MLGQNSCWKRHNFEDPDPQQFFARIARDLHLNFEDVSTNAINLLELLLKDIVTYTSIGWVFRNFFQSGLEGNRVCEGKWKCKVACNNILHNNYVIKWNPWRVIEYELIIYTMWREKKKVSVTIKIFWRYICLHFWMIFSYLHPNIRCSTLCATGYSSTRIRRNVDARLPIRIFLPFLSIWVFLFLQILQAMNICHARKCSWFSRVMPWQSPPAEKQTINQTKEKKPIVLSRRYWIILQP